MVGRARVLRLHSAVNWGLLIRVSPEPPGQIDPAVRLEELYIRHRQGLFTLALSITRSPQQAEDAVHEAFMRLFRRSQSSVGDPSAYVFMSVRNAAIDQIRKRKRDHRATSSIYSEAAGSGMMSGQGPGRPDHDALLDEKQQAVREAIERLEASQREVIVMKVYGGLTFDQIAQVLGTPLSTVASRYRRGLARLEEQLSLWK